ncbi:integrin subunit alpha inflated isoform X2 [Choristoneura fumiferana]|uniref:integrin subunit alpha inflated isoform X2 n=1 Tax=Choristoneura fumiferana TaxID=7141 RepID=UPI003D15E5FB
MAVVLCVLLCAAAAAGFNVDIPSRVVYRGSNNSMFGFTVQAHIDGNEKMILVGAPEADSSYLPLRRPGAVYRCAPGQRGYERAAPLDMCREMLFDKKRGNNEDKQHNPIDQKSDQWFGATLSSTGRNGPIVACAPRYVSFVNAKLQHRDPVGSCFVASSSDAHDVKEYSPCRTPSHGQRKTGVCQAGFSAAISRDGQRLFMGAPGSWYWQGRTISIDPSHTFNSFYMKIPEEGQVYSQSVSSRPVLIATPEASPKYDDSYMGYSVAVGDFAGQGEQGVAVGVPRGAELKGLVVLYTWELQNIKNISGSQIGAYFGYSLASGDIDGDGTDDVIVGAPMYSKLKSDGFEHGRVYVIYQGKDRSFLKSHARTGEVSRGRFGFSVASLGDINYDGFGDIAVGAPYGGESGRGVVYIYQGSEFGIREKYSQAITAEEIAYGLTTFGFSLSGGVDLDNNNYTDLAVGAYKSDSVVFLKSRPVVKVMAEVKFMSDTKLISLTDKQCTMRNGSRAACSDLMYCLRYDGINVDKQIKFNVSLDLDSRQTTTKRILTERRETVYTTNIMLVQGQQKCERIRVYLDEEIRDKLTPIEVKMTYELLSTPAGNIVPPVLDQTQSIQAADSLNIQKNCGPDNVCIPDLKMMVTTPINEYVIGSGENINIDVAVENNGEDAFEAAYYLKIPAGVTYAKMERLDKDSAEASSVYCSISPKDINGTTSLKCELGNPMSYGEKVNFRVVLEVDVTTSNIVFDMESNSTNPELNTGYDNVRHLSISVLVKAILSIIGASDPPELHYNASLYESSNLTDETKLGPQVIHKYNIKNEGPFTADEAEIYIMWPYQTLTGETLMYMLVQPQPLGNVRCDVARHVNPDNLLVQNPYAFLLTKEKEAMLSSDFASVYAQYMELNSGDWLEQRYYTRGSQSSGGLASSQNGGGFSSGQASGSQSWQSGQATGSQGSQTWQSGERSQGSNSWQSGQTSGSTSGNGYREESRGEGFTSEQQENIRRQLANAAQSGFLSGGAYQTSGGSNQNRGGLSQEGLQEGHKIVRWKNRTIVYDEHNNIVSQTETSTEYGSLGHEGEAGSSFHLSDSHFGQQGLQGGHVSEGSQSGYASRSQGGYASGSQNGYASGSQSGYAGGSQNGYASGSQGSQGSQQGGSFVHGNWGTTETVNRDVMKADSSTFRTGVVTLVDAEEDQISGFGVDAARSSNNEFKYGIAQVGDGSSSGQTGSHASSQGSYQGGYQNGYQAGGQYSGGRQSSRTQSSRSGGGYSYSSQSGYSTHSNGAYSSAEQERRESTRRKREEPVDGHLMAILDQCNAKYNCAVVRCTTGRLLKGQEVWVALRARLNATVLSKISKVQLSSLATAHVTQLPIQGRPERTIWHNGEARTLVSPQLGAAESGSIPLWVVVLAAVIGALLLLLLIFALYKCGFFKRNRPSDHNERQPLNGRDEHL